MTTAGAVLTPSSTGFDRPHSGGSFLGSLADIWAMTRRNLVHISREPMQLSDVTIQPLLFTVLFVYIFGGAIPITGRWQLRRLPAGRDPGPEPDDLHHGDGDRPQYRPARGHDRPLPARCPCGAPAVLVGRSGS